MAYSQTLAVIASGQFRHMKFKLLIFGLIISFSSRGQTTIKGLVYDKVEPTPGVIVTEMGTDNKVMTNVKGEFEIITKTHNPTLVFSFVGFVTRSIEVKKNRFLKVKMKWTKRGRDIAMKSGEEATTANTSYKALPFFVYF